MTQLSDLLIEDIKKYYSDKFRIFGATSSGVDWNSEESQFLRFEQICKIIDKSENFSINDLGTGYGAFFDFLNKKFISFSFFGWDLSEAMILHAQKQNEKYPNAHFSVGSKPHEIADYTVASGIFNVKQKASNSEWKSFVFDGIETLSSTCRIGFAFNCLTKYSDSDKMRDHLFYADPCELFDFCKKKYSKNVALLHDYELYEFTILVRK